MPAGAAGLFKLEKAHIDLRSVKIQMVFATLLILVTCVASRWQLIASGGLSGDEDARTMGLISSMFSETSHIPAVVFCHPLFVASLLPDALLLEFFPQASLWLNLGIVFGTCLLAALIVLEITGLYGNRLGAAAAMWTGLLLAVHPTQGSGDMVVVNRPELLAHLFYLGALWSFLRFRLLGETVYFNGSLLGFLLALLSGPFPETATYPVVILLAAGLLHAKGGKGSAGATAGQTQNSRCYLLLCASMAIAIFGASMAVSFANPAERPSGFLDYLRSDRISYDSFSDAIALVLPLRTGDGGQDISYATAAAYVSCLGLQAVRVLIGASGTGPFLFASFWTVAIAIVMTFARPEWLLEPQLAAVPVCMFLALAALPAVDAVSKRSALWLSITGVIALSTLFASWSALMLTEVNKLL
jgi:hypothetical protein